MLSFSHTDLALPVLRKGARIMDLRKFMRDEEGQGLVEYALIIVVIAIAVIVAMVFLRGQIENIFSNIGNNLT
jgi:pilus assembly protein Flp/PilA